MEFWRRVLEVLDTEMTRPEPYGWFHLMWFAIAILAGVLLCIFFKQGTEKQVRCIVLTATLLSIVLEVYKQINYTFISDGMTINVDYQWYIFPWQFCSMPMYVGLAAGITKKGRIHDALCAFLATYASFAGICVMFYPVSVFIGTIGINIQTMICHGSMITVGIYLLYTGYVKAEQKTILKAIPVFCTAILVAITLNEIAHLAGITETEDFNMFFISPHEDPSLPLYSIVQEFVPYPFCLIIYIGIFTLAAYLILLIYMGLANLFKKKKKTV